MIKNIIFLKIMISILIICGCKKENAIEDLEIKNKEVDLSLINKISGEYTGDYFYENGWVLYNPTIVKLDSSTLILNYWPARGHDSIILLIDSNHLEINDHIFNLEARNMGGENHLYYYDLKLSADGSYANNIISMTFEEEIMKENETEFKYSKSGFI